MDRHIYIKITGRVQGVGFRYHTKKIAEKLKISGFVRNNYDGSVIIEASGEFDYITQFTNWCYEGPAWSHVENVEVSENKTRYSGSFSVK